jgi:GT2 family glycosyltransferase
MTMMAPAASLVIPTRDRREELRALLESALAQTVPVEILVMDDGASDAVATMIREEFPQVRYHSLGTGRGPAFQRNRGIELASTPVVFPLDDDTVIVSPRTIAQTLAEFDDTRVAAVGIPFVNVRLDQQVRQRAPSSEGLWVEHAFVAAAHAIRRSVFLQAGGYREHFFYMGEEGDLSIRLLNAGYVVRLGTADPIQHLESPRRNFALADHCGRRNDLLFAWHNVPLMFLPLHLAGSTLKGVIFALRCRRPRMLLGIVDGYTTGLRRWRERRPVTTSAYRLHRRLKRDGPLRLEGIERRLTPLAGDSGSRRPHAAPLGDEAGRGDDRFSG